jgi:hypothetical protein
MESHDKTSSAQDIAAILPVTGESEIGYATTILYASLVSSVS